MPDLLSNLPTVVQFEGHDIEILTFDDTPWIRGHQISDALGYTDSRSVANLYNANAAEFTEAETRLVSLDTAGGKQTVRVFSPRGCYLIGFLARTEKSKAFRRWALDVLEAHRSGQLAPAPQPDERLVEVRGYRRRLRVERVRVEHHWGDAPDSAAAWEILAGMWERMEKERRIPPFDRFRHFFNMASAMLREGQVPNVPRIAGTTLLGFAYLPDAPTKKGDAR